MYTNHYQRKKSLWKRLVYWCLGIILLAIVALVLFIKLDTATAANFTDQVLRPLIGDANVVAIEKVFFNTEDKINQIKYAVAKPQSPFLLTDSTAIANPTQSTHLNLASIKTTAATPLDGEGQWHNIPLSLFSSQTI